MSPDGEFAYAVDPLNNSVVVARVLTGATLSFAPVEILVDQQGGNNFLAGASALAMTSDGSKIYVVAPGDSRIVEYARNSATGKLTSTGRSIGTAGLGEISDTIVLTNGQLVVLTSGDSIHVFGPDLTLINSRPIGGGASVAQDTNGNLLVTSASTGIAGASDVLRVFNLDLVLLQS